jgi:hypothetical protein
LWRRQTIRSAALFTLPFSFVAARAFMNLFGGLAHTTGQPWNAVVGYAFLGLWLVAALILAADRVADRLRSPGPPAPGPGARPPAR